jgi:polyprenyldihydroxybenzoate methyltransferase/3-demethylubiquinol 3-O-methyltransferase
MGAQVTGIDATERNIRVARLHAASDPLVAERVEYRTTTVEDMVAEGTEFDGVMCLEVVEHVRNPADFCSGLGSLARVGGKLVMSTMNRTPLSYGLAILGAEYIANIVPRGTHDWERFVTPEELTLMVEDGGMELCQMAGVSPQPLPLSSPIPFAAVMTHDLATAPPFILDHRAVAALLVSDEGCAGFVARHDVQPAYSAVVPQ